MSTSSREKQALGVFIVLIVLGFCGLCWYLVAGHSWNVAASAIDEKVGQMDGYTAIVYAGTVLPEVDSISSSPSSDSSSTKSTDASSGNTSSSNGASLFGSGASSSKKKSASSNAEVGETHTDAASGLTSDVDSIAAPVVSDASEGASEANGDTASTKGKTSNAGSSAAGASSQSTESAGRAESSSPDSKASEGAAKAENSSESTKMNAGDANASSASESSNTAARSGLTTKKSDPVEPDAVRSSYEGKGAQVLALDTVHPSVYEDGAIIKRGQKRIGVFSVDVPLSEEAAQERIAYFKEAKTDMIVCISSVRSYVRNVQGIDIVITLQDDEVSTMGINSGGTFYVNAPSVDTVGAILVSPSNVVSAKVVESL